MRTVPTRGAPLLLVDRSRPPARRDRQCPFAPGAV